MIICLFFTESELQAKLATHEAEIRELKSMYLDTRQESDQIKDKGDLSHPSLSP